MLTFPLGLVGLLSLPVILALHLIRERQRRHIVSDLGLWSFLDLKHRGPRPRRLPLTWLLLLDLTAAALLSLAWAQPRWQVVLPIFQARQHVLLLDVSTSMRARVGISDRLSQAKAEAAALLDRAGPRDIVTLLAFGRTAHLIGDSRQMDRETLAARLAALQAGETGHALDDAAALALSSAQPGRPVELHILTDGAFPETAAAPVRDLDVPIHWRFYGEPQENGAVLELNAAPLDEDRFQVFARFANFGGEWSRRRAILQADGQTLARTSLEIPAESTLPQVWEIAGPYRAVTVTLEGEDGLPEDDSAYLGLHPGGAVRVVLVANETSPLHQALQAFPEVELETIFPEDYHPARVQPPADLTVFRGFIPPAWPPGAVLVIEPPSEQGDPVAFRLAAAGHPGIPAEAPLQFPASDPVLVGIDFGGVRWGRAYRLEKTPDGFVTLLQAGEQPLLLRGGTSSAPVWVLLADISSGNFTRHPAFPILMANFVLRSREAPFPPRLATGEVLVLPETGGGAQVMPPDRAPVEIPASSPARWTSTLEPGLYRVILPGDEASQEYLTGVNAGSPDESDLRPRLWIEEVQPEEESRAASQAPGSSQTGAERPLELAPWLLGAALIILLLEASLAWR